MSEEFVGLVLEESDQLLGFELGMMKHAYLKLVLLLIRHQSYIIQSSTINFLLILINIDIRFNLTDNTSRYFRLQ